MTATQIDQFVQIDRVDTKLLRSLIVARNFIYVDWNQVDTNLENAFTYLASIRVHDIQLWASAQVALASGAVQATSAIPELPPIKGQITALDPLDAKGQAASWQTAVSFSFSLIADGTVTIPKTALVAVAAATHNPILIAAMAIATLTLPHNITFDFGHTAINIPLKRGQNGKIQQIGEVIRPSV